MKSIMKWAKNTPPRTQDNPGKSHGAGQNQQPAYKYDAENLQHGKEHEGEEEVPGIIYETWEHQS